MLRRRPLPLAIALALGVLVMACSDSDGRTLPPADPAKTTTTPSAPVVQGAEGGEFTLTSPSFVDGQVIPAEFTCEGSGVSPDLVWTGMPADSAELALVVRDRTIDGFLHWVVAGIDPSVTGFGKDGVPEGVVEPINGSAVAGWSPPCPPAGTGEHSYEFTLHALPGPLGIDASMQGTAAADLIEQASTAQATLTVTYAVP